MAQILRLAGGNEVTGGGFVYKQHAYRAGKYMRHKKGGVAAGGTWGYARTDPKDHFAEHYMKAIHVPKQLAADLLDQPKVDVTLARAKLNSERATFNAVLVNMASPPTIHMIVAARAKLTAAEQGLKNAEESQAAKKKQFDIMRNDIFETDKEMKAAVLRLTAAGKSAAKIRAFTQKAARASTPQQVKFLESQV